MLLQVKRKIKLFWDRIRMFGEFFCDYIEYSRWNYNSRKISTQNAYEAKILRQAHIIEKGLSLSKPRKGFGQSKIFELFSMMDEYIALGFSVETISFKNAVYVLRAYISFQDNIGYQNEKINTKLSSYFSYIDIEELGAGITYTTREKMELCKDKSFPVFFTSRHSIRQFDDKKVSLDDIKKAVEIAKKAPSACNRQASKVYFYESPDINKQIGQLIAGNKGFEDEVKNYLVLTADISAFYDTFERNQLYIEAGMMAMALIEALHYYGIASCILQNGEYHKKNRKFKKICKNIPENEKIVLFIAIGYYKEKFSYAVSLRKPTEEVLIIN